MHRNNAGFRERPRRWPIDLIVVHESVTYDLSSTIRVLRRRKLGVHYAITPEGTMVELASPGSVVGHAGVLNDRSLGVEVITPYYPRRDGTARPPWVQVIEAGWAHRGEYVLPLGLQMAALYDLLEALMAEHPAVPDLWPGAVVRPGYMAMKLMADGGAHRGIVAHCYTAHADGAFPVLYCYLRRSGLGHMEAWGRAVGAACDARQFATL